MNAARSMCGWTAPRLARLGKRSPSKPSCVDLGGGVVVSPATPLGPLVAATQEPQGVASIRRRGAVVDRGFERSFDVVSRRERGELVAQGGGDDVA